MIQKIEGTKDLVETDIPDVEFARRLFACDSKWTFSSVRTNPPYTNYFDRKGSIIAVVIYDNQKCTRKIFLKKGV